MVSGEVTWSFVNGHLSAGASSSYPSPMGEGR